MNYEKFPFGKYKGQRLEDIPSSYLVYALKEFDLPEELTTCIKMVIVRDLDLNKFSNFFDTSINEKQINMVYKTLCKKYHPDMGGDNEAMKAINEFKTELLSL